MKPCLRILVVDHNSDNRDLMTRMLTRYGHQVISTSDGYKALAIANQETIDVILMDVNMPYFNGFEVLDVLQRQEKTAYVPVIAITLGTLVNTRQACLNAGFAEHIAKPMTSRELSDAIDRLQVTA